MAYSRDAFPTDQRDKRERLERETRERDQRERLERKTRERDQQDTRDGAMADCLTQNNKVAREIQSIECQREQESV